MPVPTQDVAPARVAAVKLARIGEAGNEQPVVLTEDGVAYSVAALAPDIDGAFLANDGIERCRSALGADDLPQVDIGEVRFGSPVAQPDLVLCVGLNYREHARETGAAVPTEPVLFMKSSRCIVGPNDAIRIPRGSTKTDWEIELAVIIGSHTHYLDSPEQAKRHIAGYAISHDVSERAFQLERGGQWVKGKSCETFNPLGPVLVPACDVDPQDLDLKLWVNGELRQCSNTADMIFDVDQLVWYASQFMVLEAGDVINTGTPAGVALGTDGAEYLKPGDSVCLEIEHLGEQRQVVEAA